MKKELFDFLYEACYGHGLRYPDGDGCNSFEAMEESVSGIADELLEKYDISPKKNRNMNTLLERLQSETPKFWKRLAWIGGVLTAVSAGLLAAPEGTVVPDWLQTAAGYLATAGFVATLLAKATTTDTELSKK